MPKLGQKVIIRPWYGFRCVGRKSTRIGSRGAPTPLGHRTILFSRCLFYSISVRIASPYFATSGVCFGRRFFCFANTSLRELYRTAPAVPVSLLLYIVYTSPEAWSTLPLAGGRAQRVSAPDAPRLGSPWSVSGTASRPGVAGCAEVRRTGAHRDRLCSCVCVRTGASPHTRTTAVSKGRNPCGPTVRSCVNWCKLPP